MANPSDPRPPAQKKADLDNHSRQLDPKNPEFQRSRAPAPPAPPAKK
jgi:hypothetical protein